MPSSRDSHSCPSRRTAGGPLPMSPLCFYWCPSSCGELLFVLLCRTWCVRAATLRIPRVDGIFVAHVSFGNSAILRKNCSATLDTIVPHLVRAFSRNFCGRGISQLDGVYLLHSVRASATTVWASYGLDTISKYHSEDSTFATVYSIK